MPQECCGSGSHMGHCMQIGAVQFFMMSFKRRKESAEAAIDYDDNFRASLLWAALAHILQGTINLMRGAMRVGLLRSSL